MDDAILQRLNRLERESRLWRFACLALLAGIAASGVRAQDPPDGEKIGEFDGIVAKTAIVDALVVRGGIQVVKKGGDPGSGPRINLNVNPTAQIAVINGDSIATMSGSSTGPRFVVKKGESRFSISATDNSGESFATDSSGQQIMKFPPPAPPKFKPGDLPPITP